MTANEIAHWKFDDEAGNFATDSSGNENNGILFQGPVWSTNGKIDDGMSLSFDGIDDYVQINNSSILEVGKNGADFSVSFWIYLPQNPFTGEWRSLLHKGSSDVERTFAIWLHMNDNGIHYRISTASNLNEGGDSNGQIPFNSWTHIAYVKSGINLQLYIDGKLDSQIPLGGPSVSNNGPLYIGKDPWYKGTNCRLNDLCIYDRALSEGELSSIAVGNRLSPLYLNIFKEIFYFVPMHLAIQLQKSGEYIAALDWYQTVYAYNLPSGKSKIFYELELEKNRAPKLAQSQDWLIQWLNPHTLAASRPNPYTRFTLMSLARCFMEFADLEFTRSDSGSTPRAHSLYMTARKLLALPDLQTPASNDPDDIILPNPILDALIMHVDSSLSKLHQGRTFSGMKRQVENYISSSANSTATTTVNNQLPEIRQQWRHNFNSVSANIGYEAYSLQIHGVD